ncbi:ATP-grasp ribosomal peptide maturase [Kribbella kalugense]|uniref:ATP-grasp ribosomal peptide maturase n=1 Tax=Kribbella kalugense TaxID=2512221 RepID=A0A4R7ZRQ3_9ACTN|nr:ATP-grasp ribosomal peptide maturase [Kribbella kalugense]TDW18100.1 ATP-grasp ribosomal peptide maturase [Kribbella kalugense]
MSVDGPVLVLTCADDPTSDVVLAELNNRGVPVFRCDPADVLTGRLEVSAHFGTSGARSYLRTDARTVDLSSVRSVYYRRPSSYLAPTTMSERDGRFAKEQAKHGMAGIVASVRGRWVNHIWRAVEAEFKPTQLIAAREAGFVVPPTIITNRVDDVRDFTKEQGSIVYKPLQNTDLAGSDGTAAAIWVDEVEASKLDAGLGLTLHLFQRRVDKVADLRVTVIGNEIFSVRLESPHIDWRRDYDQVRYSVVDTPVDIAAQCRRYLDKFGLLFGAFDFGLTGDGSWVWYECNTGGQWHWLELETGLPMTAALADLLEITR